LEVEDTPFLWRNEKREGRACGRLRFEVGGWRQKIKAIGRWKIEVEV